MRAKRKKKIETTLKMLTKEIHAIWEQDRDKVITIMNVNVAKTYDHVSHVRLLHNLKKRKISNWIIQWIKSFLKKRRFSIIFEKKINAINMINAEISQKFSVLLILYLFFNANLLNICEQQKKKTTSIEFVNDVNVLTYSTSTEKNCKILKKLHEIFTTWFRRHEAIFFSTKYELIHFNKNFKKFNMQTMINLKKMQLTLKTNIRILELQINTKLKWEFHVKKIQDKMTNQTLALTKLIASTWKITFNKIRHIYKTMIKSNIIYKSIAWHELKNTKLISKKIINDLTIIQNNCLRRIFDIYKTTFITKLKTKTHILFINIYLNELQAKVKQRFQCSKHYEKIKKIKRKIHKTLQEKKNKHKKTKFTSRFRKKVWLKNLNKSIKKQKTVNAQKNQNRNQKQN